MLSIAVDVQGPAVVRPYLAEHGVTFPVAVDTADIFGHAYGLKAIPVTFLVDEVGLIRLQGGGPSGPLLQQIESVLEEPIMSVRGLPASLPAARSKAELRDRLAQEPSDGEAWLALAQLLDREGAFPEALVACETAARLRPKAAPVHFTWGLVYWHMNRRDDALAQLKRARDLEPDNWRIRKQIWAIEHPERFYMDRSPDYDWQREELAREAAGPGR